LRVRDGDGSKNRAGTNLVRPAIDTGNGLTLGLNDETQPLGWEYCLPLNYIQSSTLREQFGAISQIYISKPVMRLRAIVAIRNIDM
jgi:hypothetical protein